jgi:hypothetical protein
MNMKSIKYMLMAACCILFTACMDKDWDEPDYSNGAPFGNNELQETNVITIAQLKAKYPNIFASTDQNALITDDIQIKGRITGNDLGGNIYKEVTLQDATGAIIIAINQSGLSGYLAEGQEILVSLKDLYIGGYRMQPEIGYPYNGNSIGRMSKDIWDKHFKIIGNPDATQIQPIDFSTSLNMNDDCAKLVTLKNVSFKLADGTATFAPNDKALAVGNAVNRELKEFPSTVVVRTSTYAKFAGMVLPYNSDTKTAKKCNITGIATRYNSTWQILIRKTSDIEVLQ